jgi:LPXTG-motif cell wall-anchored protein
VKRALAVLGVVVLAVVVALLAYRKRKRKTMPNTGGH